MGWERIEYACGHTGREQMYGHHSGRNARAQSLGQWPCPDCKASQGEDRGCLPLRGTDKQRAWAGDMRASYLANHPELSAEECATLPVASSWWITNRRGPVVALQTTAPCVGQNGGARCDHNRGQEATRGVKTTSTSGESAHRCQCLSAASRAPNLSGARGDMPGQGRCARRNSRPHRGRG